MAGFEERRRANGPGAGRGPQRVADELLEGDARQRLARYLERAGFALGPEPIRRLSGGLANRNYLLRVNGEPAVLRRPPDGPLPRGAHDMGREHRVLRALSSHLPFVPRGLHHCPDSAVIGAPFQLIEYRDGLMVRGDDLGPLADDPDAGDTLCKVLVSTLADLHRLDPDTAGLGDLGRPEGFLERQCANWVERARRIADGRDLDAAIGEIAAWLERQRFRPRPPVVLHCDFKLDNLILDPRTLAVRAVIDWDMGTRGDPLFDLATMLSYWAEPGDPDCLRLLDQMPTAKPGFWSRERAAGAYAELTGRSLDDLLGVRVLAMLKLGTVFLQLHGQWLSGAVSDPRYAGFRETGEALLLLTRDLARGKAS